MGGHLDGAHTHGGGGGAAIAVALAAAVASIAGPVISAAAGLLEDLLIITGLCLAAAIAAASALLIWRLRRGTASAPQALPAAATRVLAAARPPRPAIERPAEIHLHLHGVAAEDLAAILGRRQAAARPAIEEE